MSPRFSAMIPWLFEHEGTAFENDPDDPGGATRFGIDQRSHPKEDIRNLTAARATEIYWTEYWQKNGCEELHFPLGEVVFNCAINCGAGRVKAILATGAKTAKAFLDEQEAFYRRLVIARPKSQKYLKGWLNRTASLRDLLKLK